MSHSTRACVLALLPGRSDRSADAAWAATRAGFTCVAEQAELDWIAQSQALRTQVQLEATGLTGCRIEVEPGHRRTEDQQRVAVAHGPAGRAVPKWPMPPVVTGESSAMTLRPSSAFATGAPSSSASRSTSARASSAPWPASTATRRPAFSICAAAARCSCEGADFGGSHADRGRAPRCVGIGMIHELNVGLQREPWLDLVQVARLPRRLGFRRLDAGQGRTMSPAAAFLRAGHR